MTTSMPYGPNDDRHSGYRVGDDIGVSTTAQRVVKQMLFEHGERGVTVAEARTRFYYLHHGALSGALSCLHKEGQIARLTERRERCYVYVLPEHVAGRETRVQGRAKPKRHEVPEEEMYRVISNAIYDARDSGRTIGDAAKSAARQIHEEVYGK